MPHNTFRDPQYRRWSITFPDGFTIRASVSNITRTIFNRYVVSDRYLSIFTRIRTWMLINVPVRSGHLLDTMFSHLRKIKSRADRDFFLSILTNYPADRPQVIQGNPRHSPPEQGYGDYGQAIRSDEVAARVSIDHIIPGSGIALYNLNDPTAIKNVMYSLQKHMLRLALEDFIDFHNNTVIKVV